MLVQKQKNLRHAGLQKFGCDHALLFVTFCYGQQVGGVSKLVSDSKYYISVKE